MYRIPWILNKVIPWVTWRGPHREEVYLTFDDGPDPEGTPLVLELLAAHGCQATFFVTGQRAAAYPDLVRRVVRAGHGLGTHSFDHARLSRLSFGAIRRDLSRTDEAVALAAGWAPRCLRPPYGSLSLTLVKAASAADKRIVLWTISAGDYRPDADPERMARWLLRHMRGGDIVLLHDGLPHAARTAHVLALLLPQLPALGLRARALPMALPPAPAPAA
ncbi:MAG: polysaccharide deacetylase family protein [bacterium]|jgi:peptidoglycan/xylan/chitin deacetylase (PgdA/CDA1 family)|nr:polysaccharide deacetylase family protein [candidate division KSB1 bacterium]MDH7559971.1 polysaccharide deacetylase family protein [bacterium]